MKKVAEHKFEDKGVDHPQYFPGCSTAYTPYDQVYVGVGEMPVDAAEDALSTAAIDGWDVDDLEIPGDLSEFTPDEVREPGSEMRCYVALYLKEAVQEG